MYQYVSTSGYDSNLFADGESAEFSEQDLLFIKQNYDLLTGEQRKILFYHYKGGNVYGGYVGFSIIMKNYGKSNKKASSLFIEILIKLMRDNDFIVNFPNDDDRKALRNFFEVNEDRIFPIYAIQEYSFKKYNLKITELLNKEFEVLKTNNYLVEHLEIAAQPYYNVGAATKVLALNGVEINEKWKDIPANSPLIPNGFFSSEARFNQPITIDPAIDQPAEIDIKLSGGFTDLKVAGIAVDQYRSWYTNDVDIKIEQVVTNNYLFFFKELIEKTNLNSSTNNFIYNSAVLDKLLTTYARNAIKIQIEANVNGQKKQLAFWEYLTKKIIDRYRFKVWENIAKYIKDKKLDPKTASQIDRNDFNQKAFQGAELAAENADDVQVDPNAKKDGDLTEADIKDKQKFLKQCVLMTQLEKLRQEHLELINNPLTSVHFKGGSFLPYRGRFYMVKESTPDQSSTINKLLIPNEQSISQFLNISPAVAAHLVPKLRFYKVFTTDDGRLDEFEFEFRNFTDSNRVNNLMNTNFDRGGDYGIKSFDFSFDGSTPATAKNDIKADLKLYFQSFEDFLKKRRFGDYEHSFVDLLLLPGGQPKNGSGKESDFQYNPSYYRIRVDVGWMIDPVQMPSVKANIGNKGAQDLAKALELINKSFYLNMIDHTMDFRDDGSVDISVNYRAYVESALKGTSLDALADKRTQESLNAARQDYEEIVNKNICSIQELNQIRRSLSQLQELLKKQSLQSIMQRLVERLMIRTKKAEKAAVDVFARTGFLDKRVELTEAVSANVGEEYLHINYFYMADLLYVILDSIYDETGENYIQGTENFKFVLTSFEYTDIFSNTGAPPPINIGSIPITTDIFAEWFKENVLKPERTSYPIMYFIRDLCKFLLVEIMSETCFKSTFDRSLNFKTANFLGKRNASGVDAMASMYPPFNTNGTAKNSGDLVIDVTANYNNGRLPLRAEGASVFDLHNYIVVYAETPMHTASGKVGDPVQDGKNGIIHYRIGQDKGIVKKIKFSKSDMQYIREARFFRHGNDGLMQLSAVYKVSLDMIGNTLYYPGMEVFIDPVGFLGANQDADPRIINSVANKLGFGGYHLVTSVKSSIAPGKFTTTVDALFHYSGDGQPSSILIGKGKDAKKASETKKIDEKPGGSGFTNEKCIEVNNKIVSQLGNIAQNNKQQYESISDSKPPQVNIPPVTTTTAQQATSPQPTIIGYFEASIDQQGNPLPGLYAIMSDGTRKWIGKIGTTPPAIP